MGCVKIDMTEMDVDDLTTNDGDKWKKETRTPDNLRNG